MNQAPVVSASRTGQTELSAADAQPHRSPIDRLLSPLEQIASSSERLISKPLGFECSGTSYFLPRYVFLGPESGGNTIRIGIFSTIRGNEPEGAYALIRLASLLEADPRLAQGYALFFYPICNPTGFEDGAVQSRNGKDLAGEFWRQSEEPEVRLLETEIRDNAFDGIIILRGDSSPAEIAGLAANSVLYKDVLEPALKTAAKHVSLNAIIPASGGFINDAYREMLKHVPKLPRPPFEIALESPQEAPIHLQVEALVAALQTIFSHYRHFISIGQNI